MATSKLSELQTQICELLGVDPSTTTRLQLDMEVGTYPVVHVERYCLEAGELSSEVRRYRLVPEDE